MKLLKSAEVIGLATLFVYGASASFSDQSASPHNTALVNQSSPTNSDASVHPGQEIQIRYEEFWVPQSIWTKLAQVYNPITLAAKVRNEFTPSRVETGIVPDNQSIEFSSYVLHPYPAADASSKESTNYQTTGDSVTVEAKINSDDSINLLLQDSSSHFAPNDPGVHGQSPHTIGSTEIRQFLRLANGGSTAKTNPPMSGNLPDPDIDGSSIKVMVVSASITSN
jgi:hypothetical protein